MLSLKRACTSHSTGFNDTDNIPASTKSLLVLFLMYLDEKMAPVSLPFSPFLPSSQGLTDKAAVPLLPVMKMRTGMEPIDLPGSYRPYLIYIAKSESTLLITT